MYILPILLRCLFLRINMNKKSKQYDTVWSADDPDQEEFLSETDVEEGHEQQWHSTEKAARRQGRTQQSLATLKAHRWLIDTSLLLVIIGLLSLLLLRRPQQSEWRQIGGDYTGQGPECQFLLSACMYMTLTRRRLTQLNEKSLRESQSGTRMNRSCRPTQRNGSRTRF